MPACEPDRQTEHRVLIAAVRPSAAARPDFQVRMSARFIKSPDLSPEAKLLRLLIAAFADGKSGETFVSRFTLQKLMRRSREVRERAQAELVRAGWLRVERKKATQGRWGRNVYVLVEPPVETTSAGFSGNGRSDNGTASSGQTGRISVPKSGQVNQLKSFPSVDQKTARKPEMT